MSLKYFHLFVLGMVFFIGGNSCSLVGENPRNTSLVEMRVNHFQQTAIGSYPVLVLLTQQNDKIGGTEWEYFYDEIEGFSYEPGFIYDLKLVKQSIQNPPQDDSSLKFILHSVVAKNPVAGDEAFEVKLKWNGENFVHNDINGEFSLLQEYRINCATLCDQLNERLATDELVTGVFVHEDNRKIKLIALK